ncbi:MAG: hypothetical protein KF847_19830 [Pirellulales bacterium]|nr:hypothetical protein [Pirellulales bacterium]
MSFVIRARAASEVPPYAFRIPLVIARDWGLETWAALWPLRAVRQLPSRMGGRPLRELAQAQRWIVSTLQLALRTDLRDRPDTEIVHGIMAVTGLSCPSVRRVLERERRSSHYVRSTIGRAPRMAMIYGAEAADKYRRIDIEYASEGRFLPAAGDISNCVLDFRNHGDTTT